MTTQLAVPELLLPSAKILLLGSSALAIFTALKDEDDLQTPFIRITVGILILALYRPFSRELLELAAGLTRLLESMGDKRGLEKIVMDAMQEGTASADSKAVLGGLLGQALRTGVWGVASSITEFFFILSSFLLEIAKDAVWQILLLLYPLACGVYPLFPGILHNFSLYAVCVALWWPIFTMITVVTGLVARHYMTRQDSWGLAIVALEVFAILMTFLVPSITHKLVQGALAAEFGPSMTTALGRVPAIGSVAGGMKKAMRRRR